MDKTPKKILYVSRPIAPPWDEASKNFAYNLAKKIAEIKPSPLTDMPYKHYITFEVHIMTKGILGGLPENVIQENIYTSSEKDFKFSQKIRLFWFLLKNAKKFDAMHLFFTPTKLNSLVLKQILKPSPQPSPRRGERGSLKVIQTVATLREDLFSDEKIKKMMFGDIITTYSEYAKNKLEKLDIKNVEKVYPGIDLEDYRPSEKSENLLNKYGFSKSDFIINFSGEYIRLGAMDDVIESFIEISQKIPEARLSLAVRVKNEKDAQKKEEVIKKLKENNLLEKVSFHDEGIFKMSDVYNLCDISLFPVRNMHGKFDVPLVVVEAMACGKPVIISDIPILREFSNENNSVQIRSGNTEDIINAVLSLYNDREKIRLLGESAQKYVRDNFSIEKASEKYSEIYKKL